MQFNVFKGSDVINIRRDQPLAGNPAFADLVFRPRTNLAARVVAGLGIYAIHFNDRLIYIGKFLGRKGDPFGGNIVDSRWTKHLGTLTMRGRRVSVPGQTIAQLAHGHAGHPAVSGILGANQQFVSTDRGCVSSLNRIRFALSHWDEFNRFDQATLDRFQFLYAQIAPRAVDEARIRDAVSGLESDLVAKCQPACNGTTNVATAGQFTLAATRKILEDGLSRVSRAA